MPLLPLCSQLSQHEGLISPAPTPTLVSAPRPATTKCQGTRHMYWLVKRGRLSGIPRAQRARRPFPPCRPPPASNRKPHIRAEAYKGAWLVPLTEARSGSLPRCVTNMHSGFEEDCRLYLLSPYPALLGNLPWPTAPRPQPSSPPLTLLLSCLTSDPATGHTARRQASSGFYPVSRGPANPAWAPPLPPVPCLIWSLSPVSDPTPQWGAPAPSPSPPWQRQGCGLGEIQLR